jgi:hypothetical protein
MAGCSIGPRVNPVPAWVYNAWIKGDLAAMLDPESSEFRLLVEPTEKTRPLIEMLSEEEADE